MHEVEKIKKRPSIVDVAKAAGVSTMTVTRALRENESISPKTRKLVLDAVEKLNFIPSIVGRSLRGGKTMNIGILITKPSSRHLARKISFQMLKEKYVCNIADSLGDVDIVIQALKRFLMLKVDAVVLGWRENFSPVPEILKLLKLFDIVVLYNRFSNPNLPYDMCVSSLKGAYETMIDDFIARDKTRIAYWGPENSPQCRIIRKILERKNCYHDNWFSSIRLEIDDQECGEVIRKAFRDISAVDAIITHEDVIAAQVIRIAERHGFDVPGQLAVAGAWNSSWGNIFTPRITTVDFLEHELAENIIDILLKRLNGNTCPQIIKTVTAKLIVREST